MLRRLWEKWKAFGERVGNITSKIILTFFYFSLFAIPAVFLSFVYDKVGRNYEKQDSYFAEESVDLKLENMEEAKGM